MDHKMAPVLLAHQKSEADTARLATAARNAGRAARRAQHLQDVAAGLVDPDPAWDPVTSGDEGKKSASRLPSLAKFIGDTEKLDITTFFNSFEMWFRMSKYSQTEKSSYAILHLDGKAQKQWWPMETKLRGDGLDPHVFSVFKTAMLTRWAPVAPGLNARGRLGALKQTKSVDTYIDAFNSIVSNAIDNPIVGAEACYFFQKGLKDSISSLLLKNSSTGGLGEYTNVFELAARAKALDAHLHEHKRQYSAVVAEEGVFQDVKGKGKAKVVGGRRHHGTKCSAPDQPESSRQGSGSHQSLVCFKCGKLGHASVACTKSQTQAGTDARDAMRARRAKRDSSK